MKNLLILLLSFSILACSVSGNNKETSSISQEAEIREAMSGMKDSLLIYKSQYESLFESKLASISSNDHLKADLQAFNSVFLNTATYIDSIWSYVDTMDYTTERNILLMRSKFIEEGLGDTLYNKINMTIEHAKKVASQNSYSTIQDHHMAILGNDDAEAWKKQYFDLINPLGVNMLLYGFQVELYRASYQALSK